MAFVWVQQWIALPIVLEEQMGDLPPGSVPQSLNITADGHAHEEHQTSNFKSPTNISPFQSQLGSIQHGHGRPDIRSAAHPASGHYPSQEHGASSLNMGSMVGALPEYASNEYGQGNPQAHQQAHRQLSGASTSALVYQLQQQNLQHSSALPTQSPYTSGQYQQNFTPGHGTHQNYNPYHSNQRLPHPGAAMQGQYQNFHQQSQYMYYPSPYGHQSPLPQGYTAQAAQSQAMYGRRPSLPNAQLPMMAQGMEMAQNENAYPQGNRLLPGGITGEQGPLASILSGTFGGPGESRNLALKAHTVTDTLLALHQSAPVSSIPRGPPRKPKQSGHALWVGNLPPGTTVVALKDHFSRDATKDIESLFLISKSNCAFVNYRTEASCTAAMHRFHDSRFNGVRLVCRLRRSSAPASGVPTGPSAMVGTQNQATNASPPKSPQNADVDGVDGVVDGSGSPSRKSGEESRQTSSAKDKYFVVKSLTLQDLELSVRNGIWATQSHNEEVLNKAYEVSAFVYNLTRKG